MLASPPPCRDFAETLTYRVGFAIVHVCVHVLLYALPRLLYAVCVRLPWSLMCLLLAPRWRHRRSCSCSSSCCCCCCACGSDVGDDRHTTCACGAVPCRLAGARATTRAAQPRRLPPHERRVHVLADERRPRVAQFFGVDTALATATHTSAAATTHDDDDDVGGGVTAQLRRGYVGPLYNGHIHTCLGNYRPLHRVRAQRQTLRGDDGCRLCLDWVYPTHTSAATAAMCRCSCCCRACDVCSCYGDGGGGKAGVGHAHTATCVEAQPQPPQQQRRRDGEAAEYAATVDNTQYNNNDDNDGGERATLSCATCRALTPAPPALVLVLPGLTGSSAEVYVSRLVRLLQRRGYVSVVLNTRGVAGVPLDAPELYSALHTDDIRRVMTHELTAERLCERFGGAAGDADADARATTAATNATSPRRPCRRRLPVFAVAFSYGGVVLSNYLAEQGRRHVASGLDAAYTLNAPHDLYVCSRVMRQPWQRCTYNVVLSRRLRLYVQEHMDMLQRLHSVDGQQLLQQQQQQQQQQVKQASLLDDDDDSDTKHAQSTRDTHTQPSPHCLTASAPDTTAAATTTTTTTTAIAMASSTVRRLRTLHDFDAHLIAPHLGYESVASYYAAADNFANLRASHTPQLCLISIDDPMCCDGLSRACAEKWRALARVHAGGLVCVAMPCGGHLGFLRGPLDEWRQRPSEMEMLVLSSLAHATRAWYTAPL